MDEATLSAVVFEIAPLLGGRTPGKIFQLGHHSLAIDFGLRGRGFFFISVEPAGPRLYLIKRRVRDLEKQGVTPRHFALTLRKELSATRVSKVAKAPNDRIVRIQFDGDESAQAKAPSLIAQLTGRSANLFLLNERGVILAQAREGVGRGQTVGEAYQPPSQGATEGSHAGSLSIREDRSISEQLDVYYTTLAAQQYALAQLSAARAQLRKEISRRKKLLKQLEGDLASHADAEQQKRIGDLLLANVSTAKREGNRATLIDYFAEDAPKIYIEIDEDLTLPEEASRRFERYARSKRARKQIAARIEHVRRELAELEIQREQLETEPLSTASAPSSAERTADSSRALQRWDRRSPFPARGAGDRRLVLTIATSKSDKRQHGAKIPGTRRYLSSDGYEILVGRAARDNDKLTFKIAKPNDLWLHAADYPGSHVIVRNPTRKDITHRTLVEAAQLAAHFSQANKDPKVDVHYTPRKFLAKPKGAAPGLVRMSRFKSITVAPLEAVRRAP